MGVVPQEMFSASFLRPHKAKVPDGYKLRPLYYSDLRPHLESLLDQISDVGDPSMYQTEKRYANMTSTLSSHYYTIVIVHIATREIVGTATLFLEWKFSFNCGCVGRLVDIISDDKHRDKGLEAAMMTTLGRLAKSLGAHRVTAELCITVDRLSAEFNVNTQHNLNAELEQWPGH